MRNRNFEFELNHVLLSTELFIQHFKIYKIAHIHLQVVLTNYEDEQHLRRSQERMSLVSCARDLLDHDLNRVLRFCTSGMPPETIRFH